MASTILGERWPNECFKRSLMLDSGSFDTKNTPLKSIPPQNDSAIAAYTMQPPLATRCCSLQTQTPS
jgi:hypothetical protein